VEDETVAVRTSKRGIKREDPPPRPVEGIANRGFLEGGDPSKHYVWVSEVNAEAHPTIGYQEFQQGDAIKSMGMVLMECSLERKAALDKVGWDKASNIEDTIRHRELDPLSTQERHEFRGITSTRMPQDDRTKWQF
jgi:hypothetical protein